MNRTAIATHPQGKERIMHIVTIGGGDGHAQVLKGLRPLPGLSLTGICPGTYSGGSTGALAREYGSPGWLGDLTKCVAALAPDPALAAALAHRFRGGCLDGHSLKNLLALGLIGTEGLRLPQALGLMERMCGLDPLHHTVHVSPAPSELCASLASGGEIVGEPALAMLARNPLWSPDLHRIRRIFLKPDVHAWKPATDAIVDADVVVICPGDLYSSILPALLPRGMKEAFRRTKAHIVIVLNIMTKRGETDGYRAEDFVREIERKIGRRSHEILHNTVPVPKKALALYRMERKIRLSPRALARDPRLVRAPLLGITPEGWLYHDPQRLARALGKIFEEGKKGASNEQQGARKKTREVRNKK